jgi:excisionase family DNA binding protein
VESCGHNARDYFDLLCIVLKSLDILCNLVDMDKAFLTAEQAAEQLQMHPRTVRRMLADGRLPGTKIGTKEWRVSAQALRDFIEGKAAAPKGD